MGLLPTVAEIKVPQRNVNKLHCFLMLQILLLLKTHIDGGNNIKVDTHSVMVQSLLIFIFSVQD